MKTPSIRFADVLKVWDDRIKDKDSAREIYEAASPDPERPTKSHNWNDSGERCLDCGDKDWFAEPVCEGKKEETE